MKKLILCILFLTSCASPPKSGAPIDVPKDVVKDSNFNYQDFEDNLASTNQVAWARLKKELKNDLAKVDRSKYEVQLAKFDNEKANMAKKDLKKFEVLKVTSFARSIVICGYSKVLGFSFCDDARCSSFERRSNDPVDKTEELAKGLPLEKCVAN